MQNWLLLHQPNILHWGVAINNMVVVSSESKGTQPYLYMNPFSHQSPPIQAGSNTE